MENYELYSVSKLEEEYDRLEKSKNFYYNDIEASEKMIDEGNLHYNDKREYLNDIIEDKRQLDEINKKMILIKNELNKRNKVLTKHLNNNL